MPSEVAHKLSLPADSKSSARKKYGAHYKRYVTEQLAAKDFTM